jgi:hypothetical protein
MLFPRCHEAPTFQPSRSIFFSFKHFQVFLDGYCTNLVTCVVMISRRPVRKIVHSTIPLSTHPLSFLHFADSFSQWTPTTYLESMRSGLFPSQWGCIPPPRLSPRLKVKPTTPTPMSRTTPRTAILVFQPASRPRLSPRFASQPYNFLLNYIVPNLHRDGPAGDVPPSARRPRSKQ